MFPAARLGDMTAHGTPLGPGPGSPNVFIEGKPAWRVTMDVHACPLVSGVVPHVGGNAPSGSTTVMINNVPATRALDTIVEATAPNTIVQGAPTVLIG
jgi:uncharacterized Zn-binding protein involved in type VI secretion